MASWLKVAEDLLEVVDRRAKSVANERSDEQSESKPSVSNGQEFQTRTNRSKKAQLRLAATDPPKSSDISGEQTSNPPKTRDISGGKNSLKASGDKVSPDIDEVVPSSESNGHVLSNTTDESSKELQLNLSQEGTTSESSLADSLSKNVSENDEDCKMEITLTANDLESVSPVNDELSTEKKISEHNKLLSSDSPATAVNIEDGDLPNNAGQDHKVENEDISQKIDQVESELGDVETRSNNDAEAKSADTKEEPPFSPKQREPQADTPSVTEAKAVDTKEEPLLPPTQQEPKAGIPSKKVQEQLDEAQGLVKSAISTGKSKEARLARVCAGLSSRLQEYKSENAQLEELLTAERERSNSCEFHIKQLQKDLSTSKGEVSRVESHMTEALAAKNAEIDALVNSLDMVKKQASVSEGKLASLQANMESMMRNRELAETRMMQALREELTSVERRAEEERAAHNATKMAAMEREVELEHRAVDASTALARMQRAVDERTSKVAELEQKLALLEVESASLNQELQDMEARARRGKKKASEEGNQALQIQAWQEEVDRARQGQRDAESKISSLEAELQKMRVEMAGMKRDAEHYSRQEHMELEKRYRELTDLLYHKQTQLETMASDKAAAEFQLEKETKRLHEVEAERSKPPPRRASSSSYWEDDTDLKPLEPLPLYHRHIVGASLQLQKAVKLVDSGAVTATRFLWRYPIARVLLLFYMVFVHLFLMYLLHRLQAQADNFAAQEVAASMGLANPNLP